MDVFLNLVSSSSKVVGDVSKAADRYTSAQNAIVEYDSNHSADPAMQALAADKTFCINELNATKIKCKLYGVFIPIIITFIIIGIGSTYYHPLLWGLSITLPWSVIGIIYVTIKSYGLWNLQACDIRKAKIIDPTTCAVIG